MSALRYYPAVKKCHHLLSLKLPFLYLIELFLVQITTNQQNMHTSLSLLSITFGNNLPLFTEETVYKKHQSSEPARTFPDDSCGSGMMIKVRLKAIKQMTLCLVSMSRSRLSLLDQCLDGFMEVKYYKSQKNLRTNKHKTQHIALLSNY